MINVSVSGAANGLIAIPVTLKLETVTVAAVAKRLVAPSDCVAGARGFYLRIRTWATNGCFRDPAATRQ